MTAQIKFSDRVRKSAPGNKARAVPARPRQSRSDARKKEILKAALHCFTRIGFAGATLADIRVRARSSIGSIYHHFRSKEQLAAALYIEGLRDYQESFLTELHRHQRARDAVRGLVRQHLRWVRDNPDWSRFLYDHRQSDFVAAAEGALKELNDSFYRAGASLWQLFADSGEMIDLPRDLLIAILLGPSQEFARNWLSGRTKTDLDDAARVLADAAWRSLGSATVKPRARAGSKVQQASRIIVDAGAKGRGRRR
jgi:AcrR family transcriptional regulator